MRARALVSSCSLSFLICFLRWAGEIWFSRCDVSVLAAGTRCCIVDSLTAACVWSLDTRCATYNAMGVGITLFYSGSSLIATVFAHQARTIFSKFWLMYRSFCNTRSRLSPMSVLIACWCGMTSLIRFWPSVCKRVCRVPPADACCLVDTSR